MRSAVQVIPSPSSSISPYAKGFREQTKDSGSLIAYEAYSGVIAMAHRMHPTKIKLAGLLREDGTFQPGISVMNTAGVRSK